MDRLNRFKQLFSSSRPLQREQEEMVLLGVDRAIEQLQAGTEALRRELEAGGKRASPEQIASIRAFSEEAPKLLALAKFDKKTSEEAKAIELQADEIVADASLENRNKKCDLYSNAMRKFYEAGDEENQWRVEDKWARYRGGKKSQSRRKRSQSRKRSQNKRNK
jgi:hypothetical protein